MSGTGSPFFPTAVEIVTRAIDHDTAGEYEKALPLYDQALEWFLKGLKHEKNPAAKENIEKRVIGYMTRAEALKKVTSNNAATSAGSGNGGVAATQKREDEKENSEDKEKDRMRNELSSKIVSEKPNIKWEDVAGLEGAKEALKEAVVLPIKFPQFFTGKRKPWKGILLYGPPGTGKSFLAKAVATEADSTFFAISSADLVSKWQGESERLVGMMFRMARDAKPAIVFIDEIDSLCTSRSEGESESSRRIKTTFLNEMDGVDSDQRGVLILGATNVPWELDSAIRRRFEKRVYIALPDSRARSLILKLNLGDTPNTVTDDDFVRLGEATSGYSGSDVAVMVREALMEPLRKCQVAKQFVPDGSTGLYSPCTEYPNCPQCPMRLKDPICKFASVGTIFAADTQNYDEMFGSCPACRAERKTLYTIPDGKLKVPLINVADFEKALKKSHSSVGDGELTRFDTWTQEFGQEGC